MTNTIGSHILGNWSVIAGIIDVRQSIWGPRRINMYVFFPLSIPNCTKTQILHISDNLDLCHRNVSNYIRSVLLLNHVILVEKILIMAWHGNLREV